MTKPRQPKRTPRVDIDADDRAGRELIIDALFDAPALDACESWFLVPWRHAGCVIGFALDAAGEVWKPPEWRDVEGIAWLEVEQLATSVRGFLERAQRHTNEAEPPARLYARAGALRYAVSRSPLMAQRAGLFLHAGLECVGKWVAHSSGGGVAFNGYLDSAARTAIAQDSGGAGGSGSDEEEIARAIERWRARDAGGGKMPPPKQLAAFTAAWRSGRPELAYLVVRPR